MSYSMVPMHYCTDDENCAWEEQWSDERMTEPGICPCCGSKTKIMRTAI